MLFYLVLSLLFRVLFNAEPLNTNEYGASFTPCADMVVEVVSRDYVDVHITTFYQGTPVDDVVAQTNHQATLHVFFNGPPKDEVHLVADRQVFFVWGACNDDFPVPTPTPEPAYIIRMPIMINNGGN